MDHAHIEEHNVVERYVLGRLAEAEQARFEDHFADCAECLEAVELAEELRAGLRELEPAPETVELETLPPETTAPVVPIPTQTRRFSPPVWAVAPLAALVVLALLPIAWLADRNRKLADEIDRWSRPVVATPAAVAALTRDADAAPPVRLRATSDRWRTLGLDVGDLGGATVDVKLSDDEGEVLWTGRDLAAPVAGPLVLSVPGRWLEPGLYRFDVSIRAGDRTEPAGRLEIEVVPAGDP